MNRTLLSVIASLSVFLTAMAQMNSPLAPGYLERGVAMYADRNYLGCIDQLSHISNLAHTPEEQCTARFYIAMASLAVGDDEALPLLSSFVNDYPRSLYRFDAQAAIGDYCFSRGSYGDALRAYSQINLRSLTDSRRYECTYRQAYSHMMLGENNEAHALFESLVDVPRYANLAKFYLGYIAYAERDYPTAISHFRSVNTAIYPGTTVPYYRAQIDFARGEYDRVASDAVSLLAKNPPAQFVPELSRIAGESLFRTNHRTQAAPYLQRYVDTDDAPLRSALYMLGICRFDEGSYAEAIPLLQQAVDTHDAQGQSAYLYLGQAYAKTGNRSAAMMAFENAYRAGLDRNISETALYNYIVAQIDGGRTPFSKTVALQEDFLARFPRSRYAPDVRRTLVNGYLADKDYDRALAAIDATEEPSDELLRARQRVLFLIGVREASQGNLSKAENYLSQAAKARVADPALTRQANLWLGNTYYESADFPAAEEAYRRYVDSRPGADDVNLPLARYNLAYSLFSRQKYADAFPLFDKVAATTSDATMKADALARAGDALYYQQKLSQAADRYDRAIEASPASADYPMFQKGVIRGLQRDHSGKITELNRMMSQYPASAWIPAALLEKAQAYDALGRTADAIDVYETLVDRYPSSVYGRRGALQLAITYGNTGAKSQSIEAYKEIISRYPTSDEAKVALDDLKRIYAADGRLPDLVRFVDSVNDAPQFDPSELDAMAFTAAENAYLESADSTLLGKYLNSYPHGAKRAKALYYMARHAYDEGDLATATSFAAELINDYPDAEIAEEALLLFADSEALRGNTTSALDAYTRLANRASDSRLLTAARLGIVRIASRIPGMHNRVIATSEALLSSQAVGADPAEVKFLRAEALWTAGGVDEAINLWSELARNPADIYGARSAVALAEKYYSRGQYAEARSVIDPFIESQTPHTYWLARGFIVLSDVLRMQGHDFEADEYLRSLRDNYPTDSDDIHVRINQRLEQ